MGEQIEYKAGHAAFVTTKLKVITKSLVKVFRQDLQFLSQLADPAMVELCPAQRDLIDNNPARLHLHSVQDLNRAVDLRLVLAATCFELPLLGCFYFVRSLLLAAADKSDRANRAQYHGGAERSGTTEVRHILKRRHVPSPAGASVSAPLGGAPNRGDVLLSM
ncbi:hypothetical protein HDA40_005513 [Hamadaea flava]|uniref:Uncharacterized protein n=1 Tax=Hamadaea flava TaxID=1742688 RepID=A0ABV8LZ29_9ACTN|nr:hypothetical protein [Hamadaea flava]MCP2327006.1 hypothetical protein [Hamadaea flava]